MYATSSHLHNTSMRLPCCAYLRRRSLSWEDMQRSELVEFQCYLFVATVPGELALPVTKENVRLSTLSTIYANKIRDLIFTYPYSTYDLLYSPQCAMTLVAGRPTANPPPSMPAPPGPPPGDCLQALKNKNRQSGAAAGCSGATTITVVALITI